MHRITVRVNGTEYTRAVPSNLLFSDFLRHELGLTGTHVGCEHGVCGACTVLRHEDGRVRAVRSCLMFAVQADGGEFTTIEGLATGDNLHPLQEAFIRHHALQCGFCTPGMILSAYELLEQGGPIDEERVREHLAGNLCRCTGYRPIIAAVLDAAGTAGRSRT